MLLLVMYFAMLDTGNFACQNEVNPLKEIPV